MTAMLSAFLTAHSNSGQSVVKAFPTDRTYPPLFTLNLPEEEEIIEDLKDIEGMQITVQALMIIVGGIFAILGLYYCCTRCRHTRTIFKFCFPFLPISRILRISQRTDLFVEVTNLTKGNSTWAHFTSTGYFPTSIKISRKIPKEKVIIRKYCCIFKKMIIDWGDIIVNHVSGEEIKMPTEAKISVFTDNDLTNINDDHFEIHLIARLLNQLYIVQPQTTLLGQDDTPLRLEEGAIASAPTQFELFRTST